MKVNINKDMIKNGVILAASAVGAVTGYKTATRAFNKAVPSVVEKVGIIGAVSEVLKDVDDDEDDDE